MSTLIEKLEREYQKWCEHEDKSEFGSGEAIDARGRTRGLLNAIQVVKRHSDWISVDERLPTENDGRVSWGVNAYKKYILVNIVSRGIVMTCRFNLTDKCFETADKVTHWMPLPKPPSEVAA